MNKSIISGAVLLAVALAPIVAMGIAPARNIILGLAPDESILKLADEIDKSRIDNAAQIIVLQNEIAEQKKVVDDLKSQIENQKKAETTEVNNTAPTVPAVASKSTAEVSSACSKVVYYEKSYSSRDNAGKSVSFTKGEGNINKYYDLRGWIKSEYGDDDEDWMWKGGYKAVIASIEKDHQDYLKNKGICK